MSRPRSALLGVLVITACLLGVFANAAQAEGLYTGAEIEANEERFEGSLENSTGALLSELGSTKMDVVCITAQLVDALLNAAGGVKEGAKVKFIDCRVLGGGTNGLEKEFSKCVPKTNGGPLGTIETLPFHASLQSHQMESGEKADTLLISPDNEKEEVVNIELGETCAFGEELPIFGLLSIQDCGGSTSVLEHRAIHLLTEFSPLTDLALFAMRQVKGSKPAKIDGSANITLASERLWAGDPPQGEADASWLILKKTAGVSLWLVLKVDRGLYPGAQLEAEKERLEVWELENGTGALLSEIGTTKIDVVCGHAELIDALLNATGGLKEGAKLRFTGCKLFSGGATGLEKEAASCQPKTSKGPLGTIETLSFHASLKLYELAGEVKDNTLLVVPDNAEEKIAALELGGTCAFGEELAVFGRFSVQDCGGIT